MYTTLTWTPVAQEVSGFGQQRTYPRGIIIRMQSSPDQGEKFAQTFERKGELFSKMPQFIGKLCTTCIQVHTRLLYRKLPWPRWRPRRRPFLSDVRGDIFRDVLKPGLGLLLYAEDTSRPRWRSRRPSWRRAARTLERRGLVQDVLGAPRSVGPNLGGPMDGHVVLLQAPPDGEPPHGAGNPKIN